MTRYARLLVGLVLLSIGGVVTAQRPSPSYSPSSAPVKPPAPWANKFFVEGIDRDPTQVVKDVIEHDFGSVPFGTVCTKKFTITNPYDVPMQILDVRVECNCLKGFPPNRVLRPNESAEFAIAMDAGKFKGATAKKMYVTFGPTYVNTAKLEFRANSREDVTLTPGLVDFGVVSQGAKSPIKTVTLKYEGRMKDWKILEVAKQPPGLDVEIKEASRGGLFAVKYYINVTLKQTKNPGPFSETVVLKTNDPSTDTLNLSVAAQIQPPVAVIPDRVTFREAALGVERQYKVLIRGNNGTPFTLTANPGTAEGLVVEGILPASNTLHHVNVRYTPKAAGPFRHEVMLNTSLGGSPMKLVVEGTAVSDSR